MTFYNLPEVDTKVEYDRKTKELKILGIPGENPIAWFQRTVDRIDGKKSLTVSLA